MNELLWFAFLILDLAVVLMMHRLFGRVGLFVVIAYSIILCNVQVLKMVEIFGLTSSLGNILYASIFLATDILSELHGKRAARRGVLLGFLVLLIMTLYMNIALWFAPSAEDWAHPHLEAIFKPVRGVMVASLVAYLISQFHDVFLFHLLRERTRGRHLWLRNNASTLVSQLIDTVVFTALAVWFGVFPASVAVELFLTAYVMKVLVAVIDTPFLYLACGRGGAGSPEGD